MDAHRPPTLLPQLKEQGLLPRKGLGQHFLTDPKILDSIVAAAELPPDAVVIEVGPGPGTLTAALVPVAGRLIAVELDARLAEMLEALYAGWENVHIIHGDALELSPRELLERTGGLAPYFVLGNIPYYITSPLLRHYLEAEPRPERLVFTLQLDVARRIVAHPPQMSLLAVSVQVYARPTIVRKLPPGAFTPPPKVHSAVLRLDVRARPLVPEELREAFFRVVRAGFGQKRKTLRNSLAAGLGLPPAQVAEALQAAGLSPKARAQELDIPAWVALSRMLSDQTRMEKHG
ncbi:MAG TPA: ribosomal RNA small subunit methyltransferase A [Anaerolineae bacterium]|nr:ribosomal RNA small subunit methyltransferase A [Anaerolineae bacterium]